jgi:hypothetical protein
MMIVASEVVYGIAAILQTQRGWQAEKKNGIAPQHQPKGGEGRSGAEQGTDRLNRRSAP